MHADSRTPESGTADHVPETCPSGNHRVLPDSPHNISPIAHRVILCATTHCGRVGLALTLQRLPSVHIVASVQQVECAISSAERHQPNVVFASTQYKDRPTKEVVGTLHGKCPTCRIILIGDPVPAAELTELLPHGLGALLSWEAIDLARLEDLLSGPPCFETVLIHRQVLSPKDVGPQACSNRARAASLRDNERDVLKRSALGETEAETANSLSMSRRSIQRIVARVEVKLDARSLFVLGMRAGQMQSLMPGLEPLSKPE